jgi:glycosyltransferase involved in cell wall biosynthesis
MSAPATLNRRRFEPGAPPDAAGVVPRPVRVLELRSVRGTGGGPEKTILIGAALADPTRYAVTVCYVRDQRDDIFAVHERAARMNVDYVEVRERNSFDPSVFGALRRLVRERGIHIVHAHEYKTDLLALGLALTEGVAPLSTVHGWCGPTARERAYYAADKRLLALYPRVVAVSSEIRDELLRTGTSAARVRTLLNAIDPTEFRRVPGRATAARTALGLAADASVIGAIGRLEVEKRFDVLVDAFAELQRELPAARLVIAGEGSLRPALAAQIARAGLGDAARLLGHFADVKLLHHALDVLVQSSDTEGTPNAILEAMAMETPIVATRVGGTVDLVTDGDHALLVPRRDPRALADAMRRAIEDRPASAARTAAARARVERDLSFSARMRALEVIYDELAAAYAAGRFSWRHLRRDLL